jgi:hypothetical protein
MKKLTKPPNYWTYNKCKDEALKYKSRTEFSKKCYGAYNKARKNKWLDNVCSHMNLMGNLSKRCIYSYEFSDYSVYVGLTYNLDKRQKNRKCDNKDQVTKHINKTNLIPVRKQLTDYIDVNKAIKLEGFYVEQYKNEKWTILNIAKTGAIGSSYTKWTYDNCKKEALKYKSKTDFNKYSSGCYTKAYQNNWLNDICSHMIPTQKPKNYWTFERCKEEALKYNTKSEFKSTSNSAYLISCRNNWINDTCSHMIKRINKIWTYNKCEIEALKYKSRIDFKNNCRGAYNISYKNNWLGIFFI